MHVLLVEDNDGDAVLATEGLEEMGNVEVERVRTLAEALSVLAIEVPTCVLLDLGLPDAGSGLDALTRVREVAPRAAVVVLTGLNDGRVAHDAIAAGAQDYVHKGAMTDGRALHRAIRHAAQRAATMAALQASNDELASFAHTVAHDLRSPLSIVMGMASVLAADVELAETERRDLAGRIVTTTERLARLVTGLLSYAEAAGQDREPLDLGAVVEWAVGLVQADLDEVGGVVQVGEMMKATSNEPALRTVVLNLLSNAVKHRSDDRPLVVSISTAIEADQAVLTVGDNGAGIAPADRDRVFELGTRATVSSQGAGIGLSSVRRIVKQLDGRVWIDDGDGGLGVRVRVALPLDPDSL